MNHDTTAGHGSASANPDSAASDVATLALADLRKSYERAELDEATSLADPFEQFGVWLQQALAAKLPEPNAMTLATVAGDGRPSTRVVLIKGFDKRGIVWYTNYQSRKGRELAGNAFAALQFHWVELERVVRIEGRVEKTSAQQSDAYFDSRPLDSRIGAWASPQSEPVADRAVLVASAERFGIEFSASDPPRPPHWGGYRLLPNRWEFWQGRRSRLHDRLSYLLQFSNPVDGPEAQASDHGSDGVWHRQRLAP